MKPKDLQYPFPFTSREVLVQNNILFLPEYYQNYKKFDFRVDQIRPTSASLIVELCSGNGHWVCAQAKNCPQNFYVAIEKRFDRVQRIWSKKQNANLDNLFIVAGRAEIAMQYFFHPNIIDQLFIHFPDPWPKTRHKKHRLFQDSFLLDVKKAMKHQGKIFLVTDHLAYGLEATKKVLQHKFTALLTEPHYKIIDEYANSTFETLWKTLGKQIYYFAFEAPC